MSYDDFYARGGWTYDFESELGFLFYRIALPLDIPRPARVLEIGCGTGLHAQALSVLFGEVEAIDLSATAIELAREAYPDPNFHHEDALAYLTAQADAAFDLVFSRGMSWFHQPLGSSISPYPLDDLLAQIRRTLRPSGHFVLQIRTDFTGTDCDGIYNHRLADLEELAARVGEFRMLTDWCGLPLARQFEAEASGRNALLAVRRLSVERTPA